MNVLERESRDCSKSQLLQKILTDEYGFVYPDTVKRRQNFSMESKPFFKMSFVVEICGSGGDGTEARREIVNNHGCSGREKVRCRPAVVSMEISV